ncbi:universal stress protein [Natronomonas marina]|jgi:nucleotide-binding universal stress UspA family protein|uniref:universal stress protein n=1 Tax=Natronomonas marina TaxID=2961939 RepID=UPI0020C94EB8|nr:universal stress protein [Natronomonas marina]
MFDTVVVATDGSESVSRAAECALDLAARFEATAHALYVVDAGQVESLPDHLHDEVRDALDEQSAEALEAVQAANDARQTPAVLETAVRVGRPADQIIRYARDIDADAVAMGTRGRHGEHSFLLGSVAERVVRMCPQPVLTVRQLD